MNSESTHNPISISKEHEQYRKCSILLISSPHAVERFPQSVDPGLPKWRQERQEWLNTQIPHGGGTMYPGEPTPLMYAAALLQDEATLANWQGVSRPEILGVMNNPVFDQSFITNLVHRLTVDKPRVVGISNLSEAHPIALKVAKIVKYYSPSTIVILGGMHETGTSPVLSAEKNGTPSHESLLKYRTLGERAERKNIDFVVAGDGQVPLLELIKIISENPDSSIAQIKERVQKLLPQTHMLGSAVVSYEEGAEITDIHLQGGLLNYNELPSLNRECLTHPNFYQIFVDENGLPKPTAQLMLQHGCFESCSFCCEALNPKEFTQSQKPEVRKQMQVRITKVLEEMRSLWGKGYRAIFFDDSTFLQNRDLVGPFLDEVIQLRAQGVFDFEWGCQTTLLSFTDEFAQKLAQAGCSYVYFGVENKQAGENNIAKARRARSYDGMQLGQGTAIESPWESRFKQCVETCKKYSLRMGASLQFGFPGESWEDQKATIDMLVPAYTSGVLTTVALNMNTLYPRSADYIAALRKQIPTSDWREELVQHPDYETFNQNSAPVMQEKLKLVKVLARLMSSDLGKQWLSDWCNNAGVSYETLVEKVSSLEGGEGLLKSLSTDSQAQLFSSLLESHELSQLMEFLALRRSFKLASRIAAYAKGVLGESVLSGVHFSDHKVQQIVNEYRQAFGSDAYFPTIPQEKVNKEKEERRRLGYLNSSAICRPLPQARVEAERVFKLDLEGLLDEQGKREIYEQARARAAKLVEGSTVAGTVLCSNTTEAVGLTYWLSGLQDGSNTNVVSTNAENVSTWFAMQMHTDHGNTKGDQGFSTFPTFAVRKARVLGNKQPAPRDSEAGLPDLEPVLTGVELRKLQVFEESDQEVLDQLEIQVDGNTKLLVISHVVRDNGRALPIKDICQKARDIKRRINPNDPELCILVDGAQALGNLARVNYMDLGADFYAATPHKTMGSEVVGLLYFDPENPRIKQNIYRLKNLTPRQQLLKKGMFSPQLFGDDSGSYLRNVEQEINPADIAGFVKACEVLSAEYGLQNADFSSIVEKRKSLKNICSQALETMNGRLSGKTQLWVEEEHLDRGTDFILSFRLKGLVGDALPVIDGEGIQQKLYMTQILMHILWSKGVNISLINRESDKPAKHRFRVSFGLDNNGEDVNFFVNALEESLLELDGFEKSLPKK